MEYGRGALIALLVVTFVAIVTFVLLSFCVRDFHRAGVKRLEDAGEKLPWWLPGSVTDSTDVWSVPRRPPGWRRWE